MCLILQTRYGDDPESHQRNYDYADLFLLLLALSTS